jgi:sulfur-carrier protein
LITATRRSTAYHAGTTLAELIADLDHRYPGLRFCMIDEQDQTRAHVRFFINGEQVFDMTRASPRLIPRRSCKP